jgi:predicted nucleotidyltransferase
VSRTYTGVVVTDERIAEVRQLLARVRDWAAQRPDVAAVVLVGSWAHDEARMDSDVDLVVLTDAQQSYLHDERWVAELGGLRVVRTAPWGPLTERRFVLPTGLEVEVGIAPKAWAATDPIDWGTRRVVDDGMCIIHDPGELLSRLAIACRRRDG